MLSICPSLTPCLQLSIKLEMEPYMPANTVAPLRFNRTRPPLQRRHQDARIATMNKVKQLYLDHRYKRCAALCEETLKADTSNVAFPLRYADAGADSYSGIYCIGLSFTFSLPYPTSRSAKQHTPLAVINYHS